MKNPEFKTFHVDTEVFKGPVSSQEQLNELLKHYSLDEIKEFRSNNPEDDEIRVFSNFFNSNLTLGLFIF